MSHALHILYSVPPKIEFVVEIERRGGDGGADSSELQVFAASIGRGNTNDMLYIGDMDRFVKEHRAFALLTIYYSRNLIWIR